MLFKTVTNMFFFQENIKKSKSRIETLLTGIKQEEKILEELTLDISMQEKKLEEITLDVSLQEKTLIIQNKHKNLLKEIKHNRTKVHDHLVSIINKENQIQSMLMKLAKKYHHYKVNQLENSFLELKKSFQQVDCPITKKAIKDKLNMTTLKIETVLNDLEEIDTNFVNSLYRKRNHLNELRNQLEEKWEEALRNKDKIDLKQFKTLNNQAKKNRALLDEELIGTIEHISKVENPDNLFQFRF